MTSKAILNEILFYGVSGLCSLCKQGAISIELPNIYNNYESYFNTVAKDNLVAIQQATINSRGSQISSEMNIRTGLAVFKHVIQDDQSNKVNWYGEKGMLKALGLKDSTADDHVRTGDLIMSWNTNIRQNPIISPNVRALHETFRFIGQIDAIANKLNNRDLQFELLKNPVVYPPKNIAEEDGLELSMYIVDEVKCICSSIRDGLFTLEQLTNPNFEYEEVIVNDGDASTAIIVTKDNPAPDQPASTDPLDENAEVKANQDPSGEESTPPEEDNKPEPVSATLKIIKECMRATTVMKQDIDALKKKVSQGVKMTKEQKKKEEKAVRALKIIDETLTYISSVATTMQTKIREVI